MDKVVFNEKVCVRIIQYFNYFNYSIIMSVFYRFLPKQRNFNSEIKGTIRYQRIKQNLKLELTLPHLAFVPFIAQDFEDFLVIFQSNEPLIHLFYE